jgi:hypothetical protein
MAWKCVRLVFAAASTVAALNNNWPTFNPPTTFTGNVTIDFPTSNPAVFRVADAVNEVSVLDEGPVSAGDRTPCGWDIHDARFGYNRATDTLYVGELLAVACCCVAAVVCRRVSNTSSLV